MKLGKMIDPDFQLAFKKLMTQPLSLKAAFKLKSIYAQISAEVNKYEEVRLTALKKYGKRDQDGELIIENNQITPNNPEKFVQELNALLDIDVRIDTISVEDLGHDVKITARELLILEEIVVP